MARETRASAQTPVQQRNRKQRKFLATAYSLLFVGLTAVYLCLVFIPSPDPTALRTFHLTQNTYYNLIIPLEVVLVVVWAIGFYGALKIRSYAWLIKKSRDGSALGILSDGLLVLILSQAFTSALGGVFGQAERHHSATIKPLTIVLNYIDVALVIAAFILVAWGARKLYEIAARRRRPLPQSIWVILMTAISAVYSYFVVIQPIHTPLARRTYYLSDWLLVLTIAIPYAIAWYFGIYGAYYTYMYQRSTSGRLYKSALVYVSAGIATVVASSIATRIIVSLSSHLTTLKITPVLVIIYALLILEGIGFILIAVGATKLKQFEEV